MLILSVKEQEPCGKSIYCSMSLDFEGGHGGINYNNMYFICGLDKTISQYPIWLDWEVDVKNQLIKLGYKI